MSVSTAQRALLELRERGLVEWESGKDSGARNWYRIVVHEPNSEGQSEGQRGSIKLTDKQDPVTKDPLPPTPDGVGEPKPEPQTPQPARCSKHPSPHPNCRRCGTNPRTAAKLERAEQAHRDRERQQREALQWQKARTTSTTSDSPTAKRALTQAREFIRQAKTTIPITPALAAKVGT